MAASSGGIFARLNEKSCTSRMTKVVIKHNFAMAPCQTNKKEQFNNEIKDQFSDR